MSRDFQVNGEVMVYVKGCSTSLIANAQELGLTDGPVRVTHHFNQSPITLDAWGGQQGVPVEVQCMLSYVDVSMPLIHFDETVLETCLRESKGGALIGTTQRAGTRLGNGAARFSSTNHFVSVYLASPIAGLPYRFYTCYLHGEVTSIPLGSQRSVVNLTWRAIPYSADPWNNGAGAGGVYVYDNGPVE